MFIINTKINKSNIISNRLLLYNFYCAFSTFQTEINDTLNVLNSKLSILPILHKNIPRIAFAHNFLVFI